VILGYQCVKNLALSAAVFGFFKANIKSFNVSALWQHSLSCAVSSRLLGTEIGFREGEDAFVAGLLHDVGRIILIEHFSDQYKDVIDRVRNDYVPLAEAEELVLGVDHAQLGYMLAEKWNFPGILSNAIRFHHDPSLVKKNPQDPWSKLAATVYLSNILSKIIAPTLPGNGLLEDIDSEFRDALNLKEGWELRIVPEAEVELEKQKALTDGANGEEAASEPLSKPEKGERVAVIRWGVPGIDHARVILTRHGYPVDTFDSEGGEATIGQEPYRLIIFDMNQGEGSQDEALEHAEAISQQKDVPIIFLARTIPEKTQPSQRKPLYLLKPFSQSEFISLAEGLLREEGSDKSESPSSASGSVEEGGTGVPSDS
jgi:putative nucleotidyltransferase with HDIG domain